MDSQFLFLQSYSISLKLPMHTVENIHAINVYHLPSSITLYKPNSVFDDDLIFSLCRCYVSLMNLLSVEAFADSFCGMHC